MTAMRREAIKLVEQMPEEQMPYVVQYIQGLIDQAPRTKQSFDDKAAVTPKMSAFFELEKMLVPISPEIDYDKELTEAREERYGYIDSRKQ